MSEVVLPGRAFSGNQGVAAASTNAAAIEPTINLRNVDDCSLPEGIGNLDVVTQSHACVSYRCRKPESALAPDL